MTAISRALPAAGAIGFRKWAPDFAGDAVGAGAGGGQSGSDRLGTDWPHPNSDYGRGKPLTEIAPPFPIDDGLLLNQLPKWVPDAAVRKKILVDNPARFYGFEAAAG